jgi:5-methylcytosine-specific restriction endonuclease McrA
MRRCSNCAARFTNAIHFPHGPCCPLCLHALPATPPASSRYSARWKRKVALLRARDGNDCWLCGKPLGGSPGGSITLDHVIPRSKGGSNTLDNLRLAHRRCNHRRGNADPPAAAAA